MELKAKDIASFLQGNWRYYKNKLMVSPLYIREQVEYRLQICRNDCLIKNKCVYCGCPPQKKSWTDTSCNGGERFPDLMNKQDWEQFKKDNNIKIETNV